MLLRTMQIPRVKPLRVLLALPGLHRVVRGAEVAFEEVARAMARLGGGGAGKAFEVTLIGSGKSRPGEPYQYRRSACIGREFFEKWPSVPYLRGHYVYEELTFTPGLLSTFSPGEFDATVTCSYPYVSWALRARRGNGRLPRHVFVTQNGDWMARGGNWEFKHFACDGLVCTNPEYYERHKDRWPCALIPNGVRQEVFCPGVGDRAGFGLPESGPVILIVAALIPSKRVLAGVRAVARLADSHLVVAGDGEQRGAVEALGRELMGDRFRRITLPRGRMPDLYRAADVLLHMSQDEPFGNIYLEATASGLPVVTHDWSTTRWILEDQGVLVDTSDETMVVSALRQALSMKSDAEVLARRALIERRFSWESVGRQYGEFLDKVCERKPPP